MQGLVVVRLIVEDLERQCKSCQSQWSAKYRSRSLGQVKKVREMCHAKYDGCCRIVVD